MKFNPLLPELYVSDFNKSLNFYGNILGFKTEYTRENPRFAFLSYQNSQLMIQEEDDDEEWHNGKPEYPYGRGLNLQIETDNINYLLKSLKLANYPVKRKLKESPYITKTGIVKLKEFLIMDPDGYLLRFSQGI